MDSENFYEETELSKDTILWRGSEFIFDDIEKTNHPLTAFIRFLGFILSQAYEAEFEKALTSVMDHENFQNSIILNNENNKSGKLRLSIVNENARSETSVEETSEDDTVFSKIGDCKDKNFRSVFLAPTSKFNIQNKKLEDFFKQLQKEVLYISNILTGALIRFYNIKKSCNDKILEIFLEKIKDIFIRNDLYRVIYDIKSSLLSRKKHEFSANLIKLYNLKPYYFGTSPYFSQDREFRKMLRKKTEEILATKKEEEKAFSQEQQKFFQRLKKKSTDFTRNNLKSTNLKWNYSNFGLNKSCELDGIKMNNYDTEVSKNVLKIPFDETLLLLRKLNDCNSMLKRIDLMFMLRSSILTEIDKFWINIPLKMKYKSVDADNLLSIFIYLIIKSQMTNLIIDIEIIDCFLSKNIKLSRKGYFFSLFQSSIEYIIDNINMEQLDVNIKEYNNFLKAELKKLNENPFSVLDFYENSNSSNKEINKEDGNDNNNNDNQKIVSEDNFLVQETNDESISRNKLNFKTESEEKAQVIENTGINQQHLNYLTLKNIEYASNLNVEPIHKDLEK